MITQALSLNLHAIAIALHMKYYVNGTILLYRAKVNCESFNGNNFVTIWKNNANLLKNVVLYYMII